MTDTVDTAPRQVLTAADFQTYVSEPIWCPIPEMGEGKGVFLKPPTTLRMLAMTAAKTPKENSDQIMATMVRCIVDASGKPIFNKDTIVHLARANANIYLRIQKVINASFVDEKSETESESEGEAVTTMSEDADTTTEGDTEHPFTSGA